jgi:hypothetical protein
VQAKVWNKKNYGFVFKERILKSASIGELIGCFEDLESAMISYLFKDD